MLNLYEKRSYIDKMLDVYEKRTLCYIDIIWFPLVVILFYGNTIDMINTNDIITTNNMSFESIVSIVLFKVLFRLFKLFIPICILFRVIQILKIQFKY